MSERPLTPPIFIAEGHDVMVFRDPAAGEVKLKEVDDGVYEGWDAEGRVLQLRTVPAHSHVGARAVRITPHDPGITDAEGLRDRLASILDTHEAGKPPGSPCPRS
jgi:hypothetical protein